MTANVRMISSRQVWMNPDGTPNAAFFRLIENLVQAITPGAVTAITPTLSPFTYTASPFAGTAQLIVQGGTVSKVEFGRDGVFYDLGVTQGQVELHGDDSVRITYTVAPTLTFVS